MRPLVQEQLKGRRLPLVMAHRGASAKLRENSAEAVLRAVELGADIIEIDIRKSRDGILYCHHGSAPVGVSLAALFPLFYFRAIQKLIGPRDTLEAILALIPPEVIVYLDIKDRSIKAGDLEPLLRGRKNVWIAPLTTVTHLRELRAGLGEHYAYAFNRPALFPRHIARRLAGQADLIQFCRWSWDEKTLRTIEESGVVCHMLDWFISEKTYVKRMPESRWQGLFFSTSNLVEVPIRR